MGSGADSMSWRHFTVGHLHGPEHGYTEKTYGERREPRPERAGNAGDTGPATVLVVLGLVGGGREASHIRVGGGVNVVCGT